MTLTLSVPANVAVGQLEMPVVSLSELTWSEMHIKKIRGFSTLLSYGHADSPPVAQSHLVERH
jgi:hypothetical protein